VRAFRHYKNLKIPLSCSVWGKGDTVIVWWGNGGSCLFVQNSKLVDLHLYQPPIKMGTFKKDFPLLFFRFSLGLIARCVKPSSLSYQRVYLVLNLR
jgi:hypothetical protein